MGLRALSTVMVLLSLATVAALADDGQEPTAIEASQPTAAEELAAISPLLGTELLLDVALGEATLQRGDVDPSVALVHVGLSAAGFHTGAGRDPEEFGGSTTAALSRFQRAVDQPATGVLDDEALIALVLATTEDEDAGQTQGGSLEERIFALLLRFLEDGKGTKTGGTGDTGSDQGKAETGN